MMETMFTARYAYVRVNIKGIAPLGEEVEVVMGVECGDYSKAKKLYEDVYFELVGVVTPLIMTGSEDGAIAAEVERGIRRRWPGLTYFVEVGRGPKDFWVQVFEPKAHNA